MRPPAPSSTLARLLGLVDLLVAAGLAVVPESGLHELLGLPVAGCSLGMGVLFCAWGAGGVVAVCGLLLLTQPRFGARAALTLGILSGAGALWITIKSAPCVTFLGLLSMLVVLVPAIGQAAIGWLLMRHADVGAAQ